VERYSAIQQQAADGERDEQQVEQDLFTLAVEVGKAAFAWLVRSLPTYLPTYDTLSSATVSSLCCVS
jgi:hypothetical protein